jgi:hypothetical protein
MAVVPGEFRHLLVKKHRGCFAATRTHPLPGHPLDYVCEFNRKGVMSG